MSTHDITVTVKDTQPYHFKYMDEQRDQHIKTFGSMPDFVGAIPCQHYPRGNVNYALMHLAIVTKNHANLKLLMQEFLNHRDTPSMWMVVRLGCQFGDVETLSYILEYSHYNAIYNPNHDIIDIGEMRLCCRYNIFRDGILQMLSKYSDSDKISIKYFKSNTSKISNGDDDDDDDLDQCICFMTRQNELIDVFKRIKI